MVPIFFTIDNDLPVMIIPDTQAHVDGHPVLTKRYNIYRDRENGNTAQHEKESKLLLEEINDPDYLGHIIIERPGHLFTYVADGHTELTGDQVHEILENINHYRDHSSLWQY